MSPSTFTNRRWTSILTSHLTRGSNDAWTGKKHLPKTVNIGKKSAICLSNAFRTLKCSEINANQLQAHGILVQDYSGPLLNCFLYRDILKTM